MIKRTVWTSVALAALSVIGTSGVAMASSHREAPQISEDPAADNTDLYAWVEGSNLVILANYIPLEEPAGGPNFHKFSDEVLYEVHTPAARRASTTRSPIRSRSIRRPSSIRTRATSMLRSSAAKSSSRSSPARRRRIPSRSS
jgi:hypothetical protein